MGNEERMENRAGCIIGIIVMLAIVVIILSALYARGLIRWENDKEAEEVQTETEEVVSYAQEADEEMTISRSEWEAMRQEMQQMRKELNQLKSKKEQAVPKKEQAEVKKEQAKSAEEKKSVVENKSEQTTINGSDITLASYKQDYLDHHASISLKNNTDKTITSVTFRIIYYDVQGNMLDYTDFTRDISIDPKMSKQITLPQYGSYGDYAYYKSANASYADHQYKIKFELKSYKTK